MRRRGKFRAAGITAISVVALATGMLALPAVSSAKTAAATIEIGPLKAAHGYTFDLLVADCAGTKDGTVIDYSKGSIKDEAAYDYAGKGTCTASRNLKQGSLSISWPGIAKAKLKVSAAGADKGGVTPKGCTGGKGTSREVMLKGSIDITASKYFGTLKSKQVEGHVFRLSDLNCKGAALPKSTDLSAEFGSSLFLSAARFKKTSEVSVTDSFTPAAGVSGLFFLNLIGTSKLFDISQPTATLTNVKPFASGKLIATEAAACLGDTTSTRNAIISGALTVDSPVIGPLTLSATNATSAYIGRSDVATVPSNCDGIGAVPLTPAVSNECDTAPGFCSVSEGDNSDTFFDASMVGTQTIVSETIDFGDGTTGTFANGSVAHVYAAPGNYTATVTIQTSNGQTQTVTTPVYIIS